MTTKTPVVALIAYPNFSPFHFAVPYLVFNAELPEGRLFDLKIVSAGARPLTAERALTLHPDGGLELTEAADILVVPGWDDLNAHPEPDLVAAMARAHARGAHVVGLCYGAYALAYAGLLDGKRASTHWMAEKDFSARFPRVQLDMNALYVDEDRLITSAGTGAGLDCCLYIVREYYGPKTANKVARTMVIPPHREGGQAQFIEQPMAVSTQDAQVNRLLDYLREHLGQSHSIDQLAARTSMSRRTFTRHFSKATGMTLVDWLVNERLQRSRDLLETTSLSVEKISDLAGFQTAISLRQHFKKRFQVSPRDWRRTFGQKTAAEPG
ncbi:GlxA family transcriptional regulator [Massilia pseudoviolaceinigra]|uniref:GlxA family transcriptional regulator n=1 Tax=Massilia pseudoviolaceinigra TaxID=3057165 RepID=UPI00279690FE|nr:helix-turn-helix domain-containing protein [Massilia sp. CCM 9206]MDQ1921264.1 helix-turn-helix domain-containing protein [Massilia sp. CCM 9206]